MVTIGGIKQNNISGNILREKPEKLYMKIILEPHFGEDILKTKKVALCKEKVNGFLFNQHLSTLITVY